MAMGGVLASTGANPTIGIVLASLAFLVGAALFVRERLVRRAAVAG
jgi:LPXTG-motif cell wall-anchored protein